MEDKACRFCKYFVRISEFDGLCRLDFESEEEMEEMLRKAKKVIEEYDECDEKMRNEVLNYLHGTDSTCDDFEPKEP